jgi:simple sugar transport system ATP-binding protein
MSLPSSPQGEPVLKANGIYKSFGAVKVLRGVDFYVTPGEIVSLAGENGAGKSTLIKILTGVYSADAGMIHFSGRPVRISSPHDSRQLGIEAIYQDLSLVDAVTATENIFLGKELRKRVLGLFPVLDHRRMRDEAARVLREAKINVPSVTNPVEKLSGGQRQSIAIARAVYWDARVMIMDEPTAALGVKESRQITELIKHLRQRGMAIIVISHNMEEVFNIVDRVVVLRLGRIAMNKQIGETTKEEVVKHMMGAA